MINWLLKKIVGTKNEREVKRLRKFVEKINQKEKELDGLTNKELVSLSRDLFYKVSQNEELKDQITKGRITEEVLLAFALVREAGKRTLGLRFFDVQLWVGLSFMRVRSQR